MPVIRRFKNLSNLFVNGDDVTGIKWSKTREHFKDEDSKGPPIHCFVMTLPNDQLRGKVLWCATQGVGF